MFEGEGCWARGFLGQVLSPSHVLSEHSCPKQAGVEGLRVPHRAPYLITREEEGQVS